MKKIFISFFVFSLMFFAGGFNNVEAKGNVSSKVEINPSEKTSVSVLSTLSDWVPVGTPGFSAGVVNSPNLAIDSNNIPYVVYADYENNNKATVMKFNGSNWETVGISGFSIGPVFYTSIAFDSNNNPYVAFSDFSNVNGKATVMKLNGTTWESVGNPGFSSDTAYEISLAIGLNNVPYVAFEDYANDTKVTVMKFDGTNWVNVGIPGFSAGQAQGVKIALNENNVPYVGYTDSSNNNKATVMKFDGTSWISVGTSGFSTGPAHWISLAIDSNNIPFVVYKDVAYGGFGTAMKFDGTNWVNVGIQGGIGESGDNSYFSIAFNSSNIPYVSYRDGEGTGPYNGRVTVCKFDGAYWVNVGNPQFSEGNAFLISLAINSDDIPYVAYQDKANNYKLTVMKYSPTPVVSSLTIIYPNGGETFTAGEQFTTTWTSMGISATDDLYFGLIQDGTNLYYSLTGHTLNDGTEVFTIPSDIHAGQYKMYGRKPNTNIDDFSDSSFTINLANQTLSILSPAGGETFTVGQPINVTWTSQNISPTSSLVIGLYVNIGNNYGVVATTPVLNTGQGTITIPTTALAGQYKIILSNPSVSATSNPFNVVLSSVSDWVNVGNPGFSAGEAFHTSLLVDSNNLPYISYIEFVGGNTELTVKKFNSTNWINVGNGGMPTSYIGETSLAIDSNDILYVSYGDCANSCQSIVKKFDGTNWVNVGAPGLSAGVSGNPSLTIDLNNVPYVAYPDWSNNGEASVRKYNGTEWVSVGNLGFSLGLVDRVSIVVDSNNNPYIAYVDYANNNKATVMKFDGTNWVNVGIPGFSAGVVNFTSLRIDSNNVPYVAYVDIANNNKATVMKFDGTNWVNVGIPGFSASAVGNLSFAIGLDDIPHVSFQDEMNGYKATVMKFDDTNWVNVGTPGFSLGLAWNISLVIDLNNIPHVSYSDNANNNKATVMKHPEIIIPSLTITSPNGGETFTAGQQFTATWASTGFNSSDEMYFGLIQNGTNLWYSLTSQTLNDGTEVFTIPANIQVGQYRMYGRFTGTAIEDYSDNSFTIN